MSNHYLKEANDFSHETLPVATDLDRFWAGVRDLSFISESFRAYPGLSIQLAEEFLTGYNYLQYRMAERGRIPFITQDPHAKVNVWKEKEFIYAYFQSKFMGRTASMFAFGPSQQGLANFDAFNVRAVDIATPCSFGDRSFLGTSHEAFLTPQKPPLNYAVNALSVIHGLMDHLPGNVQRLR